MPTELTLHDYMLLLRRRIWVILALAVAATAVALIWSATQTPLYASSARILINQQTSTAIFDPVSGTSNADRAATNEVELLKSQLVQEEAAARLGYEAVATASAEARADVIVVRATNTDPARAREIAQTFAEAYLDVRRNEFISERLDSAEKLLERIARLDEEIAALGPAADTTRQERVRNELADSYDLLVITADLGENGNGRIIDNAKLASAPFVPRTERNVILGALLGLLAGAGAALTLESLDRSVKTREVIEQILPGVPALAIIPILKDDPELVTIARPDSVESEAFKSLRASLDFVAVDREVRLIQITSASASAGKTTVAANLAVVMAATGKTVIVVDADLRRPRLHTYFNMDQVPGMTSVILGQTSVKATVKRIALDNGRLFTLASGPVPPGPSELLGSERARVTFERLRQMADVVIVDSPPVLPVADALIISKYVDATILVANAKRTNRDAIVRAVELLEQAAAPLAGTVLNQVSSRGVTGYGYGYGYGYGTDDAKSGNPLRRSNGSAPRHEGTAVLPSVPQFAAAKSGAERGAVSSNGHAATANPKSTTASALLNAPEEPAELDPASNPEDLVGESIWSNSAEGEAGAEKEPMSSASVLADDAWGDDFVTKS